MALSSVNSKATCNPSTHLGKPLYLPLTAPRRSITTPVTQRLGVAAHAWFSSLLPQQAPQSQTNGRTAVGQAVKPDGKAIITRYYEAYNNKDYATMEALLAPDVEWHDMSLYEEPFRGREAVMAFKRNETKVIVVAYVGATASNISGQISSSVPDFAFVIDDISSSDPYKVGLTWHVELQPGVTFPFSRGCSFCTFNEQGQITYARDLVEPTSKPGDTGVVLLGALAPLIRKLGPAADPANMKKLPVAAAAVWAFAAGYFSYIMFSTAAPGLPAFNQPPEVLEEVFNESLNFFYVNIGFHQLGLTLVPSVPCPPVSEALFNFVGAWGLMFLPVLLTEKESKKVGNTWAWWTGIMFLTNVFFIPFLAFRAAPGEPESEPASANRPSSSSSSGSAPEYPDWTKAAAAVGLGVGLFSMWWAVGGRPEYGDLQARLDYFTNEFSTNRVFYAFVIDSLLYSVWQAVLLGGIPSATPAQRFVPFFGLAQHLLTASQQSEATQPRDS